MNTFEKLSELGIELKNHTRGQYKTVCPKCSHERKNKNEPCLSVNIDTGAWTCHNCGWNGRVYEKRDRTYVLPIKNTTKLSDKTLEWFNKRKISNATVMAWDVTESRHYFPQVNEERNAINFNYYRDGELINVKYRDGHKNFSMAKGAELVFYGLDKIKGNGFCVVTEGECFHPDTELLTPMGWKKISDNPDEVAVYSSSGSITFEKPVARIKKKSDSLIYFESNSYKSCVTPDHNMVVERMGLMKKVKAKDISSQIRVPRTGFYDGPGLDIDDWNLRLVVAISADFTIRKEGDIYGAFKKERKFLRFSEICSLAGVEYTHNIDSRGYHSLFIRRKNRPQYATKLFDHSWIGKLSRRQINILLEEILYWDGNSVPNRNQIEYATKEYSNATFIQTLAHLSGVCSTIIPRQNEFGKWYKVSILFNKQYSTIKKAQSRCLNHNDYVHCVQVSTGMLLTRYKNSISVSGNCDALAYYESNVLSVCSVPNGASKGIQKLEYLDNCIDEFKDFTLIYIATDNDEPGIALRNELARRFGKHRCQYIDFGDVKDANEYLIKYGPDALKSTLLKNSKPFPIEGVIRVNDFSEKIDHLHKHGFPKGYTVGNYVFDNHLRFIGGQWTLVVGLPYSGKSEVVDQIVLSLAYRYDWRIGMFSSENMPYEYHFTKLAEKYTGKRWGNIDTKELKKAKEWIHDHFYWINISEKDLTLEYILEKYEELVVAHGLNGFVIDPWNQVDHLIPKGLNETQYISKALSKLTSFVQRTETHVWLVTHPTKPQKTKEGKAMIPKLSDAAGSMHFVNKAYNGIVVWRDFEFNTSEVQVQKVKFKFLGSHGVVPLNWDGDRGGQYWPVSRDLAHADGIEPVKQKEDIQKEFPF